MNSLRQSRLTLQQREGLTGYAFILPNLIGICVFVILPMVMSFVLSLSKWSIPRGFAGSEFVGLRNFAKLISDERFLASIGNNLYYTFGSVPILLVLSILLAVALNKSVYCRSALRILFFMPNISSIVSVAVVWLVFFHPTAGPVNMLLRSIGISNPPGWFISTDWVIPGLILMSIWYSTGYYMLVFLAGLQSIPNDLYESADIDGASAWKKLISITLPMLSPTIFFVVIVSTINSFKIFDQVNIMTEGGPGYSSSVLVYIIYYYAFKKFEMGYASAVAWILFVIIFFFTLIQWRGQKKWVTY